MVLHFKVNVGDGCESESKNTDSIEFEDGVVGLVDQKVSLVGNVEASKGDGCLIDGAVRPANPIGKVQVKLRRNWGRAGKLGGRFDPEVTTSGVQLYGKVCTTVGKGSLYAFEYLPFPAMLTLDMYNRSRLVLRSD